MRGAIQKRLDVGVTLDGDDVLQVMLQQVSAYKLFDARIIVAETDHNCTEPFLEVSMKTKDYEVETGPFDAVRVVVDRKLHFQICMYGELVEDGTLLNPEDISNLMILKKLNDKQFFVCKGIRDYSSYKQSIGYDSKSVTHVSQPTDTVRHVNCTRICEKSQKQRAFLCNSCSSLKLYLAKQKRKHDSISREDRQQSSSTFPFEYLSPVSKKARMTNIRSENKKLRIKVGRVLTASKDVFRLELNDNQGQELTELVHAISSSKVGMDELEKIFDEAEEVGEERSCILRKIWEDDVSDIGSFNKDQLVNGKNELHVTYIVHVYIVVTGKRGNRWSPITIRLCKF